MAEAAALLREMQRLPSQDLSDPDFRRLKYVRYADDFIIGFTGTKREAREIKEDIRQFLATRLKLELSNEKTLITHAASQRARFLGYDVGVTRCDSKMTRNSSGHKKRRYLTKGRQVLVEGRLRPDPETGGPRVYFRQDGTAGASFEVVAQTVRFLGSGNGNGSANARAEVEEDSRRRALLSVHLDAICGQLSFPAAAQFVRSVWPAGVLAPIIIDVCRPVWMRVTSTLRPSGRRPPAGGGKPWPMAVPRVMTTRRGTPAKTAAAAVPSWSSRSSTLTPSRRDSAPVRTVGTWPSSCRRP
jgi:hypothetical protein